MLAKLVAPLLIAAGCVADSTAVEPDAAVAGQAAALFELPRSGQTGEFYTLPFPNDLRRKHDGALDLTGYPRLGGLLSQYVDTIEAKTLGFGTNSAIYARFSVPIDPMTLPVRPVDAVDPSASVYLVDIDPNSPDRGRRVPLRVRFEHFGQSTIGTNWLAGLPYPGFPLRPKTTYAFVITARVKAENGRTLARAPDFEAIFTSGGDAAVEHARAVYAPLLTWLDETGGDARDDVVSAAVFTTQDPVGLMASMREVVYALPEPSASVVTAKPDKDNYHIWEGSYEAPNFQSGTPPYLTSGGEILSDADGRPMIARMESMRFALTVPSGGAMPSGGWPIVLYAHGTGGDYRSFISDGTAKRMAAEGLAVISIDQILHGPRDPTHSSPEYTFFNFQNPVAARDNVRQGGVDNFQLLRLVAGLNIDGAHFDATKIYFFGHSQGGLTGPPFLAVEPRVSGAVLSGAGALIYVALLNKTEPIDITGFVRAIINDDPLDEFNPFVQLVQSFIEPADPANYAPLFLSRPLPGVGRKNIFQSEGFTDHYAPNLGIEALGVAIGLVPVEPVLQAVPGFALRGEVSTVAPVENNLDGKTGVFVQYQGSPEFDGHFVSFLAPAAQRQSAQFLRSLARTGTATLVAP